MGYRLSINGAAFYLFLGMGRLDGHQASICELIGEQTILQSIKEAVGGILTCTHKKYMFVETTDDAYALDIMNDTVLTLAGIIGVTVE